MHLVSCTYRSLVEFHKTEKDSGPGGERKRKRERERETERERERESEGEREREDGVTNGPHPPSNLRNGNANRKHVTSKPGR